MKMNKKGFTLIELLAVIVILAIIALIATPIVLGIINDARKSSANESAKLIVKNVELAYSTAYTQNDGNYPDIAGVAKNFKMDGATMDASTGKITVTGLDIDCVTTTSGKKLSVTCTPKNGGKAAKTSDASEMTLSATE